MTYGIWLSFNNQQEGFQLPVNPESINVGDGGNGKTYDITNLGEINVIKSAKLTSYAFGSIFPAHSYPFLATDLVLPPSVYKDYLIKWLESKRPIRFIYTGSTFDINVAASIEDFQWKEVAGSNGDIEYTLKLKKYVFYAAQRVHVAAQTNAAPVIVKAKPKRPVEHVTPKTYTLASGDTLWKVAKAQLEDGSRWQEIQTLNKISDAQLKTLAVGRVLQLPQTGGTVYA